MKNKNNNKNIVPDPEIMAEIEEDLTLLFEITQEKRENEFILVELYEVLKKLTAELKDSLEELNIVDQPGLISRPKRELPMTDELKEYLKSLN